jgi:hypothetical protein
MLLALFLKFLKKSLQSEHHDKLCRGRWRPRGGGESQSFLLALPCGCSSLCGPGQGIFPIQPLLFPSFPLNHRHKISEIGSVAANPFPGLVNLRDNIRLVDFFAEAIIGSN